MKTYMQKSAEVERKWHVIDVSGKILGRVATEIAELLIGKHKPTYTPHIDAGDYVVVLNAKEIKVTAGKENTISYARHSGFPGGFKVDTYADLMERHPERIIEKAVYNMIPKNKLRQERMNRLKVYAGTEHKHESQIKKV
ncbi:MAG TPA: 50S ribosomal protein L13 [Patescibacteria group bacterium]